MSSAVPAVLDGAPGRIRHDRYRYRERWRIEVAFNRLKDSRRIATRYDKLARNSTSALAPVAVIAFWCRSRPAPEAGGVNADAIAFATGTHATPSPDQPIVIFLLRRSGKPGFACRPHSHFGGALYRNDEQLLCQKLFER